MLHMYAMIVGMVTQYPQSWANRLGVTLTPVSTGVWAAERSQANVLVGDIGTRTVIARAQDGALIVHHPACSLDDDLQNAISSLGGGVSYIIVGGDSSHVAEWTSAYPDATVQNDLMAAGSAIPGLDVIIVEGDGELDREYGEKADGLIAGSGDGFMSNDLHSRLLSRAIVRPWLPREKLAMALHVESKTLLCGRAWWNIPGSDRPNREGETGAEGTGKVHACSKVPTDVKTLPSARVPRRSKLWVALRNRVLWPIRRSIVSQGGINVFGWAIWSGGRPPARPLRMYNEQVASVLSWDFEALVPAHGDILRGHDACHAAVADHFVPRSRRSGQPDLVRGELEVTDYNPGYYANSVPNSWRKPSKK